MHNDTQRAQSDIKVLSTIHIQLIGMEEYIFGKRSGDVGLQKLARGTVRTVAELQEPPYAMLLTPLLEYGQILADGVADDREIKIEKLSDLVRIVGLEIMEMQHNLRMNLPQAA